MNNFVVLQHELLMISSSEHPSRTYSCCYEYVDGSSKGFVMPYYSIKDFLLYDIYIITETNEESNEELM